MSGKKPKYMIVVMIMDPKTKVFKRKKILHSSGRLTTIHEYWRTCKAKEKPLYCAENRGRARTKLEFELVLIYPKNRWSTEEKVFRQDKLGRNQEVDPCKGFENHRIKDLIPWWEEEKIYDGQQNKHIYYDEMFDIIWDIKEPGTVFILNNKIFVQVDNTFWVYQNKNINDGLRLFLLLRTEMLSRGKANFIFTRPVTKANKKYLYDVLEINGGFKRSELLRHYSY
jgi:hypothetical protein